MLENGKTFCRNELNDRKEREEKEVVANTQLQQFANRNTEQGRRGPRIIRTLSV